MKEKGITLIALVVTIVVLIILAGVSISMLTGENGIMRQAQNAKEQTEIGKEKEMITLAVSALKGQEYATSEKVLTSENLQKEMDEITGKDKTLVTGTTILTVLFRESNREYYVNSGGELTDNTIDYSTIYTYTEDGYITGLKDEYITLTPPTGYITRYASINKIKISELDYRYMIEELNGILVIPNKIDNIKIIGIGNGAFSGILNLKKVKIEGETKSIGDYVFSGCDSLTNITIPDSVTSIERSAFSDTIWYNNLPDGDIYIGKVYYKYKGEMPENTSIIIREGTTQIGIAAFVGCDNLTNITIPDSVTSIERSAFSSCDNLTNIIIPESVTSIGHGAFRGCSSLTNITISGSVTSIGDDTFNGCNRLTTVNYTGTKAQWNAITIGNYGNDDLTNATIHCTDGDI